MRTRVPLLALAVVLLAAPAAHAGGFATVGLSSTPDGVRAGTPWRVDITVLQHGRSPVVGVSPTLQISSGADTRIVDARPTGTPGVYRAEIVFPRAGRWSYAVTDGFADWRHTFAAVRIGSPADTPATASAADGPAPAPPASGGPDWALLGGALLALAGAAVVLAADRRRRGPGAPGQAPEPA
jgi:hypothetical protein